LLKLLLEIQDIRVSVDVDDCA